jgi:hypothetical protein
MDKGERQHLEKLRKVHIRRLRVLELQVARLGANPPADVVMEVEDLGERIAEIDAQLPRAVLPSENLSADLPERKIRIVLDIDFAEWNPILQEAALRAFAAVMDIPPDKIKIMDIQPGSVKVVLRVPEDAADRLLDLYKSEHPVIHDLYIESVADQDRSLGIQEAAPGELLLRKTQLEQQLKELQELQEPLLKELQKLQEPLRKELQELQEPLRKELQELWMRELLDQLDQLEQRDQQEQQEQQLKKLQELLDQLKK